MNNQGDVVGKWGDGTYAFRLNIPQLIELEQKCDAPFAVVFNRLASMTFGVKDVYEAIRLGLIGAGMGPVAALQLVDRYVLPLDESAPIARAIVAAAMFGFEAAPVGEAAAAPSASTNASTPHKSPEQPTSLASILDAWDQRAFGNTSPL